MSLSRKDTLAALDIVKAAVSSTNDAIQERSHIWFGGDCVYGTNGGLGIKVELETPFKCGVPGALIMGLLNQASSDTVEFKQEGGGLRFKAGRSSIKLATLPFPDVLETGAFGPWRFPKKPAKKPISSIKVSDDFIKGLKRVLALKPSAPKRMEHHAVCIFKADNEIDLYTIVGSESMAVMPVSEEMNGPGEKLALPRELANQIVAHCKPGKVLNLYSDHFRVQATDKIELFSNIFDTSEMWDLPTYLNNYVNEKKYPSTEIPEELTAALERAVTLSAGDDAAAVKITAEGKKLKLTGKFRYGEIQEQFDLTKAPTATTVRVNAKTLLSIKDVKKFSLHPKAMVFYGDDDFIYAVSSSDDPRAQEAETQEEDGEEEERRATPRSTKKTKTKRREPELDDDISDVGSEEEDA